MNRDKPDIYSFLATFFGVGYLPKMPGTWGTAVALGVYLLLPESLFVTPSVYYSVTTLLLFCLAAVFISGRAESKLGHDAGSIVIDEVCGYLIAVMFLPKTIMVGVYAFLFFRVFDIAKPYPISRSQRLPGGWGVVADDVLAGLFANVLTQIIIRIYPRFFGL